MRTKGSAPPLHSSPSPESNESDDLPVALVTAACFSAAYLFATFWEDDDRTINRLVAPVVDRVGELVVVALVLALPAATCALIFALRGRPAEQAVPYAALTALLTGVGVVVGFLLIFFMGVAG